MGQEVHGHIGDDLIGNGDVYEPVACTACGATHLVNPKTGRLLEEADRQITINIEWEPIATAPFDRDLELAVIGYDGAHALVFPCRRILGGWMNAKNKVLVRVYPTHWREWAVTQSRLSNAHAEA
jgi:hypothetical protein